MEAELFERLKKELQADAAKVASELLSFATKWTAKEAECATLTPEQNAQMDETAKVLDEVLDEFK